MVRFLVMVILLGFPRLLAGQELEFKGYLNDMQMVQFPKLKDPWFFDNEVNNRLDLSWNPGRVFGMGVGMRNRFIFGQSLSQISGYKSMLTADQGLVNMTWELVSGNSYLLVSQFDRAWISLTTGKVQLTIGRQRINWGQAFVWNPNDVLNTYSFYNFDYPERPGSDAIRIQFYPSSTSAMEAAVKWNNQGQLTVAGLCRLNMASYDVQVLGGLVDDQNYMVGAGWSGNISQAGFRGEISYFYPKHPSHDTSGLLLATVGADYMFSNSLSLIFQVFYNQLPPDFQPETSLSVYQAPVTPTLLSFTDWNIFLQGSYPVTPLFEVTLAGMYYPDLNGYFIGPNLTYSLRQNIDLNLYVQYFNGHFTNTGPAKDQNLYFQSFLSALFLKWSF